MKSISALPVKTSYYLNELWKELTWATQKDIVLEFLKFRSNLDTVFNKFYDLG